MPLDDLLRITGASAGVHRETITADAAGGGGWKYVGPNRSGAVKVHLGGAFDRTTGDETIGGTVQLASDSSGTGATTVATMAAVSANNRGLNSASAAQDSLGMVTQPYSMPFTTTTTLTYVRWNWDVSGTTPSVAGAVAYIEVDDRASLRSGV